MEDQKEIGSSVKRRRSFMYEYSRPEAVAY